MRGWHMDLFYNAPVGAWNRFLLVRSFARPANFHRDPPGLCCNLRTDRRNLIHNAGLRVCVNPEGRTIRAR